MKKTQASRLREAAATLSRRDFLQRGAGLGLACRTSFAGTTMNCEFVAQWPQLDLTGANIAACSSQIATAPGAQKGFDFSGAVMSGVSFDNLDLSRCKWTGAVLTGASFQHATLDYATGLNGVAGIDPNW